jgi:hypothetical protein
MFIIIGLLPALRRFAGPKILGLFGFCAANTLDGSVA